MTGRRRVGVRSRRWVLVRCAPRARWCHTVAVNPTAHGRKSGTISIEWVAAVDAKDAASYGWELRCDPPLPDDLVGDLLKEIVKVY